MKRFHPIQFSSLSVILLLIFAASLNAQKHDSEPLRKDFSSLELRYNKVMEALETGEMKLALLHIDTMEFMATAEQDFHGIGHAQNCRAEFFKMTRQLEPAKQNYKNALQNYLRSNSTGEIFVQYLGIGEIFRYQGQLDSALYYLNKADVYEDSYRLEGWYNKGTQHNVKARIYSEQGKFDLSIKSFLLAIEAATHNGSGELRLLYNNLAAEYLRVQNYDRADYYADKCYELNQDNTGSKFGINRNQKAIIAMHRNELAAAEEYALEGLEYFLHNDDQKRIAYSSSILSKIYFKQGEYAKAAEMLATISIADFDPTKPSYTHHLVNLIEQGLAKNELQELPGYFELAVASATQRNDLFNQLYLYQLQAKYYDKQKEYKNRSDALLNALILKDSLFNIQRTAIASDLAVQYETKKKEQLIEQLEFEDEVKKNKLATQRWIITGTILALCLLGTLLFLLFKRNEKIKTQNVIIAKALAEKDLLMREIHHRVNNNLQIVSSLLGLQGMSTEDKQVKEAINDGKARVMSMALIHQGLYNKENLTSVNVKDYLEKLCRELVATYQIEQNKIELKTDIQEMNLDVETLIPLGLIINELLTNAIKYAFPNQEKGQIQVRLFEENKSLFLNVKDDGVGMSDDKKNPNSFGFKLINSLLRQLDGVFIQQQQEGTHFQLEFREYRKIA